ARLADRASEHGSGAGLPNGAAQRPGPTVRALRSPAARSGADGHPVAHRVNRSGGREPAFDDLHRVGPPAPELTVRVLPEGFGKRLGPAGAGYRDVRFERARLRLEARQGQVFVESPLQAGQPGRVPGHAGPDDPGAAGEIGRASWRARGARPVAVE